MAAVLVPGALATLVAMVLLRPGRVHLAAAPAGGGERALGTVTALTATTATVRLTDGPEITADLSQGPGAPRIEVGDRVVMIHLPDAAPGGHDFTVVDRPGSHRGTAGPGGAARRGRHDRTGRRGADHDRPGRPGGRER